MYCSVWALEKKKQQLASQNIVRLNLPICPLLGDSVGSDPAPSGSGSWPREDGAGVWLDAHGPRQGPKPRHDGPRRGREPHGGRPQTKSFDYSGGHPRGEGGANATLCGESCKLPYAFFVSFSSKRLKIGDKSCTDFELDYQQFSLKLSGF